MSKKLFPRIVPFFTLVTLLALTMTVYAFSVPNGDFESTPVWSEYSSNGYTIVCNNCWPTYDSNNAAFLAGANNEVSFVTQAVTLPLAPDVTLFFSYWIDSGENGCHYDTADVQVTDALGQIHVVPSTLPALCAAENTGGWAYGQADLSYFAGQTVDITFQSTTDGSIISKLAIDDVNIDDVPFWP